mmetsp:Transcript_2733/g.4661  ORF Transcript_2733/g.4661 Transcript_2733/m.4661 type:complete len:87 (-) Transcript_2733:560-820(-)
MVYNEFSLTKPGESTFRQKFVQFATYAPVICFGVDMLLNQIKIPASFSLYVLISTLLYVLITIVSQALMGNLPIYPQNLNYFPKEL